MTFLKEKEKISVTGFIYIADKQKWRSAKAAPRQNHLIPLQALHSPEQEVSPYRRAFHRTAENAAPEQTPPAAVLPDS